MSSGMGRGRGSGSTGNSGSGDKRDLRGTIQPDLFTRKNGAPKTGTSGRVQPCYANFIPIEMEKADYMIYQYHVDFVPSVDSKHAREQMLLHPNVVEEVGKYHVFDGMIMYMIQEWENTQTLEVPHPTTKEPVAVTFKLTSRYGLNDAQTINTFNTIIRRCFDDMGLTQLGRHYFETKAGKMVREYNMRILPGYETAIRMYEEQLMLCIENRFKMVRMDTMLDLVRKEQIQTSNTSRVEEKMNELYGGSTIVTLYNNKLHRFTRIDFSLSPMSVFEKDGVEITLKDYFMQQYQKRITDDQQPIIISEGKPKQPGEPPQLNYLIPELCNPTGLTDEMRKDFKMMREIASHTRLSPSQRLRQTRHLLEKFNTVPNVKQCLDSWGIRMSDDLANLKARVLSPENLIGDDKSYQGQNAEWARGVKTSGIFRGALIQNWIVIAPTSGNQGTLTKKFIDETQRLAAQMKVTIGNPLCVPLSNDVSPTCYLQNLKEALNKVSGHDVHMIVVILADDNKTRYDSVKKFLCVECPTPSQCVNIRTLSGKASDGGENKNFSSIVLKIVLQMICKAGGALWKVNIPLPDTMIVGYDLYHDSTLRGKTVGACVSTTDPNFTSFYSQTRPHENPTQLGTNLTHFIRKALKKYYDCNDQKLPTRIILYRDGAGDGQIPYIRDTEVKLVTEACNNVAERASEMTGAKKAQEISLAFIIVTKRVNMRILKQSHGGDATNPEPGTVVDTVVTRPERMDFYLVPQFVNQGTVTPVSYNIIYDNTDLNPDKHQKLAFKLCHVYYNWQGTVRVPAPCQYAHKLAFLTAQSLHEETHESLRSKLFFL